MAAAGAGPSPCKQPGAMGGGGQLITPPPPQGWPGARSCLPPAPGLPRDQHPGDLAPHVHTRGSAAVPPSLPISPHLFARESDEIQPKSLSCHPRLPVPGGTSSPHAQGAPSAARSLPGGPDLLAPYARAHACPTCPGCRAVSPWLVQSLVSWTPVHATRVPCG